MIDESNEDIETLMQEMNDSAHEVAAAFDVTLDYSDDSIRGVESILGQLHDEYVETGDDSGLRGIALFYAAYIGEVIRRKGLGGSWKRHHPEFGDNTFPFSWNGAELFPANWCEKRIFEGPQDDVVSKYQVLVLSNLK